MTAAASLAGLAMVMTVLIPFLTGRAVDSVQSGASAAHVAARAHDRHELLIFALLILLAGTLRMGLTYARRMIAGRVSLAIEYDLREQLYGHLQRLELSFFDRQQTGQLMSRATVDLQAVRFFLGYGLVFILQSGLTIVLAGVAMILIDPELGLIALAPSPLVVFISQRYGRRARPAVQEVQQRIAELTADVEENISGVRVVKAFAREARQRERFSGRVGRVFDQAMLAARLQARYNPILAFLPQLGLAAVLLIAGERVIHNHLSLGDFSSFYLYLNMLLGPMRQLGLTLGLGQRATASGARIFQVLDREPQLTSPPGAPPLPAGHGHIELQGVTLGYGEGDAALARPALVDVDLDIAAGSTVAFVGPSGSGKTTLAALIPRLYDPQRGEVLIDGADVRSVELGSLRRAVAVVSDDPFLFSATVAENIAYARAQATREEIVAAARRAQAHDFIERLPQGYDTRVGERGLTLSGGQRQRLAIARALLADPRILILDDATSSVDASTEQRIKAALRQAMAGRTTLIIAHRASTIALADEIVVLEDGRVAAHGDHEQLLAESEMYREIVERGSPEPEPEPAIAQEAGA
ncbi:MAG TPA: ABC transporter ATP-binding protein [Solirubrobacteraceae bacterium]|nr:ABC transporter ATP-binding protein [Solirubrobacteraceae bacterium]